MCVHNVDSLCAPTSTPPHPIATPPSAQVLCGSEEQLREAGHEVAVMRRLRHPCLLALEAASTQLQRAPDGGTRHVVLMLFPGEPPALRAVPGLEDCLGGGGRAPRRRLAALAATCGCCVHILLNVRYELAERCCLPQPPPMSCGFRLPSSPCSVRRRQPL